jgi:hypothetical protein
MTPIAATQVAIQLFWPLRPQIMARRSLLVIELVFRAYPAPVRTFRRPCDRKVHASLRTALLRDD